MSTETDVAARFAAETAQHQMTVLRDDGLYRHVRFMHVAPNKETGKPERSSFYWFDLVTWPGCLTVNGDCGTFTFSRPEDMFEFFRGGRVNPQYWAEKVRGEMRLKRYSSERFREHVMDDIRDSEKDYPGLAEAVEREIFGPYSEWNTEFEDGAREALADFAFGDTWRGNCPSCGASVNGLTEADAYSWASQHRAQAGHHVQPACVEGFRFTDTWEWELGDWDWQYLWCCHAIQWGIWQYDGCPERNKPTSAPAEVPLSAVVVIRPVETVELPA
jgi:hypothetical protein